MYINNVGQSLFEKLAILFRCLASLQCRLGISMDSGWNNWSFEPVPSHMNRAGPVMSVEELWVRRADQRSTAVATQGASHHQRGQRSPRNQLCNSWQTPKLQRGWSFRMLGLAEFWCEVYDRCQRLRLERQSWAWSADGLFQKLCGGSHAKVETEPQEWAGIWVSSPRYPKLMQRCWNRNHFTRWQGERGKIVSLATSGPSAFHANAEKIHTPLSLDPNHFREAERKVMKEKVREGKPERQGKRGRGRE